MKVWTTTQFEGFWPVGVSAVVVADTAEQAAFLLNEELVKKGLQKTAKAEGFKPLHTNKPKVEILQDGDY